MASLSDGNVHIETITNEAFRVFDDYFSIQRTSEKPLETYIQYGICCALAFSDEIKNHDTRLSIAEREDLLQGIKDALKIGVDYLCVPIQHEQAVP